METTVLTPFEIIHAAQVGIAKNASAIQRQRQLEAGRTDPGWDRHVNGAIAEYVVAKSLGRCWAPIIGPLDTLTGDIEGIQVKSTLRRNGSLIVRTQDPPEFPYVLVLLDLPAASIAGWMTGAWAKTDRYWRDQDTARGIHQAAFFVPQSDLAPIDSLVVGALV